MSISPKHSPKRPARKGRSSGRTPASDLRPSDADYWHWKRRLRSPAETTRLGRVIGTSLVGGEVLGLYGLVGAGKTTLVRGIAEGLGADSTMVGSPTFVLVQEYHGRLPLIHADLYRIRCEEEVWSLGLDEYFDEDNVTAIEWADKSPRTLPHDRLEIRLEHRTAHMRQASFRAQGPLSGRLLTAIRSALRSMPADSGPSRKRVQSASGRRPRS